MFTRLGYKEGVVPFHEGGWKDVGATAKMIITFCQDIQVNCYVHHREDLMTYVVPNVDSDTTKRKTDKPIVNISIWGDHVYFYASGTVGRCEMTRIAGKQASANPQLEYGKVQEQPERDQYSNCVIESPFRHEKMSPFDEWRTEGDLYHAIFEVFDNFREEFASKKRKKKEKRPHRQR